MEAQDGRFVGAQRSVDPVTAPTGTSTNDWKNLDWKEKRKI